MAALGCAQAFLDWFKSVQKLFPASFTERVAGMGIGAGFTLVATVLDEIVRECLLVHQVLQLLNLLSLYRLS